MLTWGLREGSSELGEFRWVRSSPAGSVCDFWAPPPAVTMGDEPTDFPAAPPLLWLAGTRWGNRLTVSVPPSLTPSSSSSSLTGGRGGCAPTQPVLLSLFAEADPAFKEHFQLRFTELRLDDAFAINVQTCLFSRPSSTIWQAEEVNKCCTG